MIQHIEYERVIQEVDFCDCAPAEGFVTMYTGLCGFKQQREEIREIVTACSSGGLEMPLREIDSEKPIPQDIYLRFHRKLMGDAVYTEEDALCPRCGSIGIKHSHPEITLQHLPFGSTRTELQVRQTRYFCPHCQKTILTPLPFQAEGHRLTDQAKDHIEGLCAAGYTQVEIAQLTGVDCHVVAKIDKARLKRRYTQDGATLIRPEQPARALGIDAFKLHNGYKYATHIIDLETGHVLWIARGKKKQVVYDFIDHVGQEWMAGVEVIACDMNADFAAAFQEKCPYLQIVYDRFHIVKNFNEKVVSKVRVDEYKRLMDAGDVEAARSMKRCKFILMSRRSTLKKRDRAAQREDRRLVSELFNLPEEKYRGGKEAKYDKLLKENELFFMLDYVKEALSAAYQQQDRGVIEADVMEIIEVCRATENKHFEWFANLLENHLDGITAHALYPYSTGKIEGVNNKIKTARRKSYGFSDDEYFFLKIMDLSRRGKG